MICKRGGFIIQRHNGLRGLEAELLKQLYKQQENEKKRKYASRILEVEQGPFTPLVFSTTAGMGEECARYHARLAELLIWPPFLSPHP